MPQKESLIQKSLWPLLFFLVSACQQRAIESEINTSFIDFWVFVGRNNQAQPIFLALSTKKTQRESKKVEVQSKLYLGGSEKTTLLFSERSFREGDVRSTLLKDPIFLEASHCENERLCLQAESNKKAQISIKARAKPEVDELRGARVSRTTSSATLVLNGETLEGCLVSERIVSLLKAPPVPFFGVYDWFALRDSEGDCWFLSDGTETKDFALRGAGGKTNSVEKTASAFFTEKKTRREVPSRWEITANEFGFEASLLSTSGHQSAGAQGPSGRYSLYGHGSVVGTIRVSGRERQVSGFVLHIEDN